VAVVSLGVFLLSAELHFVLLKLPYYRQLHQEISYHAAELLTNALQVAICVATVMMLHHRGVWGALADMGFARPVGPALGFALIAASPMLVVYALAARLRLRLDPVAVLHFDFVSPIAEEVLFRGFLFHQLYRYARFGFWPSVLLTAVFFGMDHVFSGGVRNLDWAGLRVSLPSPAWGGRSRHGCSSAGATTSGFHRFCTY